MVEKMPDRMDLWVKYRELRKEDAVKATMFYKHHRAEMREGAVVAWAATIGCKPGRRAVRLLSPSTPIFGSVRCMMLFACCRATAEV